MKKECTAEETRLKAEAYCSLAERCTDDVLRKLEQWGAPAEAHASIVESLKKERYLDEQRYAIAFVRDKYRFSQWGRVKISQALRMKHVVSEYIYTALEEIDEEEYTAVLASLLQKKRRSVKAANDYERNGKLIRFALSHGYDMGEILRCMKQMGCEDEYME
jgi:regulatory protein